jgi:hypothetical protein
MPSSGTADLKDIFKMLDVCAPEHVRKQADHYWHIKYNGKHYSNFPKGEHGSKNPQIQIGHIRKIIRFFNIEECAKRLLPILQS